MWPTVHLCRTNAAYLTSEGAQNNLYLANSGCTVFKLWTVNVHSVSSSLPFYNIGCWVSLIWSFVMLVFITSADIFSTARITDRSFISQCNCQTSWIHHMFSSCKGSVWGSFYVILGCTENFPEGIHFLIGWGESPSGITSCSITLLLSNATSRMYIIQFILFC
jgi:hypothetical protein